MLRGSIWLDGEVTSVGGTDKVPVFDCTFGIFGKKYYKVVTVNGAEGLETIKKWNRFFRESFRGGTTRGTFPHDKIKASKENSRDAGTGTYFGTGSCFGTGGITLASLSIG